MEWFFLAQEPVTGGLSGAAGWAGLGASGLLAMVLYWVLMHHIPSKDKMLKEVLEGHNKVEQQQRDDHKEMLAREQDSHKEVMAKEQNDYKEIMSKQFQEQRATIIQITVDNRDAVKEVTNHCEKELQRMTDVWRRDMDVLTKSVENLTEAISDLHIRKTRRQGKPFPHDPPKPSEPRKHGEGD
jgi:hypothetical protein